MKPRFVFQHRRWDRQREHTAFRIDFSGIFDVEIRINLMDMYTGFLPNRGYAIDSDDGDDMLT